MSHKTAVCVRELAAWGFDEYEYRSVAAFTRGEDLVGIRAAYEQKDALQKEETENCTESLCLHASRTDLLAEMRGLDWSIGIVDLRNLISFQRRLSFDDRVPAPQTPALNDWPALFDFAFGPAKKTSCRVNIQRGEVTTVALQSFDPNTQFQISAESDQPLVLYAGSPFIEVATFRGRWFLRDGYHRSYALLQRGVFCVPAVIVHARTLAELGATRPCFFAEEVLFSSHPPLVTDFLEDRVNLEYMRPRLLKTLRVTIEESLIPEILPETNIEQETPYEHCNQTR